MRFRIYMRRALPKLAFALVALGLAGLAFRAPRGIRTWVEQRQRIQEMEKRNAQLARENELKRERLERLRANPAEQDLEIRQRLKLVQPGEKIFIVK
jgi:cell division protein FtsB